MRTRATGDLTRGPSWWYLSPRNCHDPSVRQQPFDRYVLVYVFPVDAHAPPNESPVLSLRRRSVSQPGKPLYRHIDLSPVAEPNTQHLIVAAHRHSQRRKRKPTC